MQKTPVRSDRGFELPNKLRKDYFAAALTFLARRDFLRAAAFLWSTPLDAALSIVLAALASRVVASSALPAAADSAVLRMAVLTVDFTEKFEARLSASVFTLRMEDLICGKGFTSLCTGYTGYGENFSTMAGKLQGKSGVLSRIICESFPGGANDRDFAPAGARRALDQRHKVNIIRKE